MLVISMLNMDNGIVIDAVSDGATWFLSQNYDLGRPRENTFSSRTDYLSNFDAGTGLGKVKGLFGWGLANGTTTDGINTSDDLRSMFIVGYNSTDTDYNAIGKPVGLKNVTLTIPQMPSHDHVTDMVSGLASVGGTIGGQGAPGAGSHTTSTGGGLPHENRPPFYTVLMIQKLF